MVLELENVNAFYEEKDNSFLKRRYNRQVLHDISLKIDDGECVGLVGESGCGKSSLSKVILGLNNNYTGTVRHYTENPQMVFQDPAASLNPVKKVGWILEEPLKVKKMGNKDSRREKVVTMLRKVGLSEEYMDRYPRELSGGQRQRVSIALSLMLGSKFVIADEAVSALDVTVQKQILDLLVELRKEFGLSYLFISHDLNVVYQMCSRILIMKDGRIIEEGSADEIFDNPKEEYTKELINAIL